MTARLFSDWKCWLVGIVVYRHTASRDDPLAQCSGISFHFGPVALAVRFW